MQCIQLASINLITYFHLILNSGNIWNVPVYRQKKVWVWKNADSFLTFIYIKVWLTVFFPIFERKQQLHVSMKNENCRFWGIFFILRSLWNSFMNEFLDTFLSQNFRGAEALLTSSKWTSASHLLRFSGFFRASQVSNLAALKNRIHCNF